MINLKSKSFWLIVLAVLITPVLLNVTIFQFGTPWTFGDGDIWLTFWGNYSGGLISAFVAYFIANSQIQKQLKIDLAQKKHDRMIAQLPSLIRLQFEVETFMEQLKNTVEERENIIRACGGIVTTDEGLAADEEDEGVRAGIEEYDLICKKFKIEKLDQEVYKLLEKIENDELHIELITCFKFYERFSNAASYDVEGTNRKARDLFNSFIATYGTVTEEILVQERHLKMEADEYYLLKERVWKEIFESNMISKFESALIDVKQEIIKVQQIKKNDI